MSAILPESGFREGGAAPVYSVASLRLIWLPIPLKQSAESLRDVKPQAVVSAATTSGRGEKPAETGIRVIKTPFRRIWRADRGGSRSASAALRSTTRATTASPAKSQRRMPRPRISISPANSPTGRTSSFPALVSRWTRSSPTRMSGGRCPLRPARIRSNASRYLPAPDGPRVSTARAPTSTAEAWMLEPGIMGPAA